MFPWLDAMVACDVDQNETDHFLSRFETACQVTQVHFRAAHVTCRMLLGDGYIG